MQLTRRNELTCLLNWRRDAAQVRDTTDVVQTVQHLTDTDLCRSTDLCGAEVTRGETRLETNLDNCALNDLVDIADVQNIFKVP